MFRFSHDTDSSRNSSTKSYTNNSPNIFFPQNLQKTMPLHFSEVSAQKPHKKGIATVFAQQSQHTKDQTQDKIIYSSRKPDSVYEEYVKTLQIQISSRERQRVEIYKNLQDVKREHGALLYELSEERKKSAGLQMKVEQMQIFLKQNEEKRRVLNNEKDELFKQFQFENQRRKNIEQNEQRLRYQLQTLQFQSTNKVNQSVNSISKLNEQNIRFKQQIQKLHNQLKTLELNNESYKKQLNDVFLQKTKIIDSILIEKQFVQNKLQKQQSQHEELKHIHKKNQETLKVLNKKISDLEQLKQSQKGELTYRINQMTLQNQSLRENYEMAKNNFKRQLQNLINEGNRIRDIINQLQKDKKVDRSHITQLERQIEILEKQKQSLTSKNASLIDQLEKQAKSSEQQKIEFTRKFLFLQTNLQQKSRQLQNSNKSCVELQSELELAKYRNSTQKDLLLGEINFLKQQISTQSNQFSSQSTKLIQERQKLQRYFNDQLSKLRLQSSQKLRFQRYTQQKQFHNQLQDLKLSHQNKVKSFQNKITQLTKQIQTSNEHHLLEKQKIIQQSLIQFTKKLTLQQNQSLHQFRQMQTSLKKEISQKNSHIKSLSEQIRILNQQMSILQTQISSLKNQLFLNQQKYEIEQNQLKNVYEKEEGQLKEEINFEKKKSEQQKQDIRRESQKTRSQLLSQINHLQFSLNTLKQEKQDLTYKLSKLEDTCSMSSSQLKSQILTLQLQKNELHDLVSLKNYELSQQYEKFVEEINERNQTYDIEKKQLQNHIEGISNSINSVIQFAEKYSGETIKYNELKLLDLSKQNLSKIYEVSKTHCESLTNFIGERLYAINILMQENSHLKTQLETKNAHIFKLQESLGQFTVQNALLDEQRNRVLVSFEQLQKSLQQNNLENNDSISKLKEHVNFYKNQLDRYESQFGQISSQIEQHQASSLKSQTRIIELEQQIKSLKQEMQKIVIKNSVEIESFMEKKRRQFSFLEQEHQTQINFLNQQFTQKKQILQNEIDSHQEKLKQFEKIIDNKSQQYQQLENHYNLIIERLNQENLIRINQYERQLQFLNQKIISSSNPQLLLKKIQILEEQFEKKQKELKIVEENNALLRKNFINSLSEQEILRSQMKQNRSQNSNSQSKEKSQKESSQQLKNKYLLNKNSQLKILKGTTNSVEKRQMNLSLTQRSYSNSQLNPKKFQTPRNSQKNNYVLNLSNIEKNQRVIETQRPVSTIQRSAPHIPLDLRKIRERNQLYYRSQVSTKNKNEVKPQNIRLDSSTIQDLVTPIKVLQKDAPDILIERESER